MKSKRSGGASVPSAAALWRSAHAAPGIIAICGGALLLLSQLIFPLADHKLQLFTLALSCTSLGIVCVLHRTAWRTPPFVLPLALSLPFSLHVVASAATAMQAHGADFALLLGLLAVLTGIFASTRRDAILALGPMCVVALFGALAIVTHQPAFALAPALVGVAIATALGILVGYAVEKAHREAGLLRHELARRATSDDITGVSNRAHILLLAQNEFARARRYGEPYSCLMIEIDDYDKIVAQHGPLAADTIVQVLTGYCVVVMRHCDSLGRLAPARFLALLPETPEGGATTLANRMCRDLAALNVAFTGNTLKFTISIGGAQLHAVDRSAGDLLRRAEQGLLDTAERGGNLAAFVPVPVAPLTDGALHDGNAL